jgi:D-alanyl-D-alanine dipeptidase
VYHAPESSLRRNELKSTRRSLAVLLLLTILSAPLQAQQEPPKEAGPFRQPDLVEIIGLDPTMHLDIRYATKNNFLGRSVYKQARAFLQRPAAEALVRVNAALKRQGYGLVIFDGYRPWAVTKVFWDSTPVDKREFVADPSKGSRHNRGCAVDLTMFDLKTGKQVTMPSEYDEMTERSHINYQCATPEARRLRDTLRAAMEAEGFAVYEPEWWHYDYKDWREYPILNVKFKEIARTIQSSR